MKKRKSKNNNAMPYFLIIKKMSKRSGALAFSGIMSSSDEFLMSIMLAKLGQDALAADALFSSSYYLITSSYVLLNPITTLVAQAAAKKQHVRIKNVVQQGWVLSAALSIPSMICLWHAESIFELFYQPHELIEIAAPSAKLASLAMPAIFIVTVDINFLQAIEKDVKFPVFLLQFIVGSALGYTLMFGKIGLPELGFQGIGFAILGQWWASFVALRVYFYANKDLAKYNLCKLDFKNFSALNDIVKLGFSVYFLTLNKQAVIFFTEMVSGWFGEKHLAINQAAARGLQLIRPAIKEMVQAAETYVAYYNGRDDYVNAYRHGNVGIGVGMITSLIPVVVYGLYSRQLVQVFIDDVNIDNTSSEIIRTLFITKAVSSLLEMIQETTENCFHSILDTFYPMIVQLITTISITIPLAYLLAYINDGQVIGVNQATCIGAGINMCILMLRWHKFNNIQAQDLKKDVLQQPQHILHQYNTRSNKANLRQTNTNILETPQDTLPNLRLRNAKNIAGLL